ncbi:helix-turn-helix transcriptional regulator [Thiobacter aerophilum]|uniref:AlpA family phage regulatory protein n=1 Tax=Thiobacter aerophilum TaxID=3121275 RepID=A0ABV0EGP2_9BURK
MPEKLLRLPEVMARCGVRRSFIFKHAKLGTFPSPVKLSPGPRGAIAWRESDIEEWIKGRELAIEAKAVKGLAAKILSGKLPASV